ncbi:GNAT family N-acetyltransferase [Streptomyces yangpuensis]
MFEHEEVDTGGSKRPTKIHLHALDPDTGDRMGTLTYHVPRRKADKILIEHLGTEDDHRRKGVGSALMDEMQRRHPGTPIDHGDRTDAGKAWWNGYTDGKKVTRGRTMASFDSLEQVRQAGYNVHEWDKWQRGRCDTYACALMNKHPHLRLGVMGVSDDDGWTPTHFFAHDDHHAYDSAGKHPLPYRGIDGHANVVELDHHPDDWGLPEHRGPQGPQRDLAEATQHAEQHQIMEGRYGPHARRHTASMTWDVPNEVTSTIHRGLTLALTPEDHAHVHDRTIPARKRAAHVVNLASARGGVGRHWSTDEDMAHHFSHTGAVDLAHHPHILSVTLHAHPPQPEHIERDPAELLHMGVQGHITEKEIPLTKDAPIRIGGVSWTDTRDFSQHHRFVAPGARGIIRQAFETPVPDNTIPYEHHHNWLPHDHFFAPGKPDLDERLFDGDRMHPEVRQHLLGLLHGFWAPRYGDSWQSWARVYLAGSEASHFYGNGDLDLLIGIDHEALHQHVDAFTGEPNSAIDEKLTDELRHGLNDPARMLPGPDGKQTGPWENTWFVNPGSYDIREIKPYAAYDITRDEWAVRPVEVPEDFGPEKLPESTWDVFDALQTLVKAIAELPDGTREREGAALYDYLHADRHSAFGPDGTGLYDPANAVWKALDKAPDAPLQQLIDWKHAHDGATATAQENAA